MEVPVSVARPPAELIDAALAYEPFDMPVEYSHLESKQGRREIAATRIAQNIGPLLGVPNPDGPFGEVCWLSSFNDLTLNEVARGAPEPIRAELQARKASPTSLTSEWGWVGRSVYGKPPNEVVNATMNLYGPSTKAATVLAGLNRLLEPQTAALLTATNSEYFQALTTEQKILAYSSLLVGVYRPQPLLIETGLLARSLQRTLMPGGNLPPLSPRLKAMKFARCEIQESDKGSRLKQPTDFEIVDWAGSHLAATLPWLYQPQLIDAERIVSDGFFEVLRAASGTAEWRYDSNPETGRHTVQSLADPAIIGPLFMKRVMLHTSE